MRLLIAPLIFVTLALTQTADEVEKRIASLPPTQRAYERYRFWNTTQHGGDYRAYLKTRGFTDSDIEDQVKLVETEGRRLEIDRWNRILTAENPAFNTKPNEFLVEMAKTRKPGTALDIGMGQGRNAIWLAQQGWDVTGFDPADKAVALAKTTAEKLGLKLKTEITDTEHFDFGDSKWDLILISYAGGRDRRDAVQKALKPGGVLIIEGAHRDATKGQSIGGAVVFDTGELPTLFPELRVVRYEEPMTMPDFGRVKSRVVRYCGERPE
jgi:2-polyprenyl-3-methyl-5-hydroxy-6-metoxy-1,4-benzoquinol methylase